MVNGPQTALYRKGMDMVVIQDYRIRRYDDLNWCVEQSQIKEKGKNVGDLHWPESRRRYLPNLRMCARYLIDLLPETEHCETLNDLIEAVEEARDAVVRAVRKEEFDG